MKKEQLQFSELKLYIGIDVHKKQWSVSIYTDESFHRTFSQPPNPKALKYRKVNGHPSARGLIVSTLDIKFTLLR